MPWPLPALVRVPPLLHAPVPPLLRAPAHGRRPALGDARPLAGELARRVAARLVAASPVLSQAPWPGRRRRRLCSQELVSALRQPATPPADLATVSRQFHRTRCRSTPAREL